MPTVPFTPRVPRASKVDDVYLAAAAADLHSAGMLFEAPEPPPQLERSQSTDKGDAE